MSNLQQTKAIKRLMQDLQELQNEPVENVSAQPLEDNLLEWHCNFRLDDTVFHLILFFPDTYPFVSPSAEFVPHGYRFEGGATTDGKKGVKICLSIFSDFAMYHTEWKDEKGMGWSPGYTVQTVLLNLLSFLAENMDQDREYGNNYTVDNNRELAEKHTCEDCGHTHHEPFPPLDHTKKAKKPTKETSFQIVDYISKGKFKSTAKPKSRDELFGYGLIVSGPDHRPALTTPCEFLTGDSFYSMKKATGSVHSMMKEEIKYFLPMFINKTHGSAIKETFEETMLQLAVLLPKCNPKRTSIAEMVIKTIPNLMSATVVEFSKGTQHTSENHLCGYFALHRLLLWAVEEYGELQGLIDDRLEDFISNDDRRSKSACPHIGEWLLLLTAAKKYRWQDAADAYLSESWRRNVMWYVKDDAKLGYLDTDKKYRLEKTLQATAVSRKLLAFQVLFLDIAMPKSLSRAQIIARYDNNSGFPTDSMVQEMKDAVKKINDMKTYEDWFKVLKLPVLSDDEIFNRLHKAVEFSINTKGYHWSFWKNQGGWGEVLKKYPDGTPGWPKAEKTPKKKAGKGDADEKGKGKGRGKGKSSVKAMEVDEPAPTTKGKGRGKGKAKAEEPMEEEPPVKGKGGKKAPKAAPAKGKGKRKAQEPLSDDDDDEEEEIVPVKGKGAKKAPKAAPAKGRGKRKAEEPLSDDDDDKEEEAPARGRGKKTAGKVGGKKAKVEEEKGKGRGRGKAPAGRGRGRGRGRAK